MRDCYPSAGAAAAQERGDRTGGREDVGACVPRLLCATLRAALASCEGPSAAWQRARDGSVEKRVTRQRAAMGIPLLSK